MEICPLYVLNLGKFLISKVFKQKIPEKQRFLGIREEIVFKLFVLSNL